MITHDLEERVEDALVAYLRKAIPGEIRVYAAWGFTAPEYPCAIVHAESNANVGGDDAMPSDTRELGVTVEINVEAAPEKVAGTEVRTARERNAWVRANVIGALAVADLRDRVADMNQPGVRFSAAQAMTSTRGADDQRRMQTTINLFVIAEPVAQ